MMANRTGRRAVRRGMMAVLLVLAACESPIGERLLEVDAKGAMLLFLFRDDNLNGVFNGTTDAGVPNALYSLRMHGAAQDEWDATTDSAGYSMAAVPAGRYTLTVGSAVLGDSLEVVAGSGEFTIAATDTVRRDVGIAYKSATPTAARALAQGRRVWLVGVALNAPSTFGDSTVHVTDGQSAIRALAVLPSGIVAGDSILFLGRLTTLDGQPAFSVAAQYVRGTRVTVLPDSVTTAVAASAGGGSRDAALVRVFNAAIADTATDPAGNRVLSVNDGSGALRLILSRNLNWAPITQFAPGAKLQATGVLVPDPAKPAVWVLKPRARSDLLVF